MSTISVRPSPTTSMAWMPAPHAHRGAGRAGRMSLTCLPARSPPRGASQTLVLPDRELAGLLHGGALRVAQVVQARDQVLLREVLAAAELDGPAVDAGQRPLALAVQPRVDHPREADVGDDQRQDARGPTPAPRPMMAHRFQAATPPGPRPWGPCRRGRRGLEVAAPRRRSDGQYRSNPVREGKPTLTPVKSRRALMAVRSCDTPGSSVSPSASRSTRAGPYLLRNEIDADGAFLRVAARKRLRLGVLELPPQRVVLPLGGLQDLGLQLLDVVLHAAERRPVGAFERGVDRRDLAGQRRSCAPRRRCSTPSTAASIDGGRAAAEQRVQRRLVLRRAATRSATSPRRGSAPALASTSVADARGCTSGMGTPKASYTCLKLGQVGQFARPGHVADGGEERVLHQRAQQDVRAELLGMRQRTRGHRGAGLDAARPRRSPSSSATRIGTRAVPRSRRRAADSGCGVTWAW